MDGEHSPQQVLEGDPEKETAAGGAPKLAPQKSPSAVWICFGLALITLCCYWPVARNGFVNLDDTEYLIENRHVTPGLTWSGIVWSLRSGHAANWHPVTWLSHMLDCQLYGLNAGGHHLTSLLLHIAASLGVFLLLNRLTSAPWRSVIVAALFAWHPLHVESVAWASERKDVLSGLFFMLTLWMYAEYSVRKETLQSRNLTGVAVPGSKATLGFYLSALFFLALGLMSKPMLVTTPFVLLLLDCWPLRRYSFEPHPREFKKFIALAYEKLPFFALAAAASVVTFLVQRSAGAVQSLNSHPLRSRIANAAVSYLHYLGNTVYPADLTIACYYPDHWPISLVLTATMVLLAGCVLAFLTTRRRPYLFIGWFWFLGMLVPTIGLVQVGRQAMADRYMYLPSIGLFLFLVWGIHDLLTAAIGRGRLSPVSTAQWRTAMSWSLCLVALIPCLVLTRSQIHYWRNGESLFRHALAVTPNNPEACGGLGGALLYAGRKEEALPYLLEAARLDPSSADVQFNLGTLLTDLNRAEAALPRFHTVLQTYPGHTRARINLACALFKLSRLEEARQQLVMAVAQEPDNPHPHYSLGIILLLQTNVPAATAELSAAVRLDPGYVREAIKISPDDAMLRYNLGTILLMESKVNEAVEQLSEAVRLDPALCNAHRHLAIALLKQGNPTAGIAHFSEARRLEPGNPDLCFDLGNALLDQNRLQEAIAQFSDGLQMKPDDATARQRLDLARTRLQHPEPPPIVPRVRQ